MRGPLGWERKMVLPECMVVSVRGLFPERQTEFTIIRSGHEKCEMDRYLGLIYFYTNIGNLNLYLYIIVLDNNGFAQVLEGI
jgi:hypothetical protein